MATSKINLSTTQYVRINVGYGQLIVEALAGDVHIAITPNKPAVTNKAFHKLTDRQRITFDRLDTNVWALAKNSGSHAVVSEFNVIRDQTYFSAYSEQIAISTDTPLIVIRNPLTFNDETNERDSELARISVSTDKKSAFKFWTTTDETAFTGGVFKPVNSGSHMESDSTDMDATASRVTAIDTSKLNLVTLFFVPSLGRVEIDNPNPAKIEFKITPGVYLVISGTSSSGVADTVIEWGEII